MTDACPAQGDLVNVELSRIPTQYREAVNFRGYLTAVLGQIEEAARVACAIPSYFDLNTAVGEQLTFIGKRMGFPRCHCVCNVRPVFGFKCPDQNLPYPIAGFCEDGAWQGCDGYSTLCIGDDEIYRSLLKVRRYQMLGLFDLESLGAAAREIWGAAAWIPRARAGKVVLAPGRALAAAEVQRLSVVLRVMPVAPGISIAMHYGTARIAGFGTGWAGFCDSVPSDPVYGFPCEDTADRRPAAGFCKDAVWSDCAPPVISAGHWLCPIDIDPYACS